MDDDQRSHLEGLRQAHLRRLHILEQAVAYALERHDGDPIDTGG